MHIHDIEIEGFENGARSGNIALVAEGQRINLPLTLSETPACASRLHRTIVAEAIRLTRRMPEYRSGTRRLSFAPRLLDPAGESMSR